MYFIHYFMSQLLTLRRNVLAPSWRRRVVHSVISVSGVRQFIVKDELKLCEVCFSRASASYFRVRSSYKKTT